MGDSLGTGAEPCTTEGFAAAGGTVIDGELAAGGPGIRRSAIGSLWRRVSGGIAWLMTPGLFCPGSRPRPAQPHPPRHKLHPRKKPHASLRPTIDISFVRALSSGDRSRR